jgi:hypothetical protein
MPNGKSGLKLTGYSGNCVRWPDLYEAYNPMAYAAAQDMEVELGIMLREVGFGVWQA